MGAASVFPSKESSTRRPETKGVVVWKPKGAKDADAVVLVAWADWVALHGPVPPAESEQLAAWRELTTGRPVAERPISPRRCRSGAPSAALTSSLLAVVPA